MQPEPPPDPAILVPVSVVLQRLHDEAPPGHVTLAWLMGRLHKRSFGIVMLLLGLAALVPGISIVAGLVLMIPAVQMIEGRAAPVFPRRIAARAVATHRLSAIVRRAVPVLRTLEKSVHPRWPTPLQPTKRVVGLVVLLLGASIVVSPVPLSNVVPALVIALIALAYVEEDGMLLAIALAAALALLALASVVVWQTVLGARWLGGIL